METPPPDIEIDISKKGIDLVQKVDDEDIRCCKSLWQTHLPGHAKPGVCVLGKRHALYLHVFAASLERPGQEFN